MKYSDDVGELVFKAGNSAKLGKNLIKEGFERGVDQAAHHIVAGGSKFAIKARDILKKFDIGINDAINGVFLNKSIHTKLHTKEYYEMVTNKLLNANSRERAIEILQEIADSLKQFNI